MEISRKSGTLGTCGKKLFWGLFSLEKSWFWPEYLAISVTLVIIGHFGILKGGQFSDNLALSRSNLALK